MYNQIADLTQALSFSYTDRFNFI